MSPAAREKEESELGTSQTPAGGRRPPTPPAEERHDRSCLSSLLYLICDLRILLCVEEIRRTEVTITPGVACVYTCGIYLSLNPGVIRVILVDMKLSTEYFEMSSYCADHHVFYRKRCL